MASPLLGLAPSQPSPAGIAKEALTPEMVPATEPFKYSFIVRDPDCHTYAMCTGSVGDGTAGENR